MNAQELKDFQEKERIEKERQQKEEQQEKAQKEKEDYQKSQEKAAQKRLDDLNKKHEEGTKKQEEERKKDAKQAEKARKPHDDLGKAREKMQKSPEHKAMREAVKQQVADKEKTAKDGANGPHTVRDQGQQAEADKYGQMRQNDAKMALGTVGKAHGSPEMQGMNGTKGFEEQQAKAALRAQGDHEPWKKAAAHDQQHAAQAKATDHGKGKDHTDPERVARDNGPDRPGPAPAPAHAHHGHMPWDKNPQEQHGGHGHLLSKEHGQELAQGKPWEKQSADPDRAESRMAEQSRAKEREQEQSR
ncbi:hypothetical protein HAP94_08495 [Acidithiobacillus ferrivorans]|nr:hypothetical protein [Acidithiobacillus ferrivorans]